MTQDNFKPVVVWLILNGKTEEALTLLAKNYKVNVPKLKVGMPKRHKIKAFGCYTSKNETIFVLLCPLQSLCRKLFFIYGAP